MWLLLCVMPIPSWAVPDVVVSIKPVHSLVSMVMRDIGEPKLLMRGAATPHYYAMRPSEAALIAQADLIVWVGPTLESFMVRPVAQMPERDAHILQLQSSGHVTPLRSRGLSFAKPAIGGSTQSMDPHLWLDPHNAVGILEAITATLSRIDPDNATHYAANRDRAKADIQQVARTVERMVRPVQSTPFVVFHDGYQYFEHAFGLNYAGALALSPERQPGVRQVRMLMQTINQQSIACVMSEPQFPSKVVQMIAEQTKARVVSVDPLGATLEPGRHLYSELLLAMADAFQRCLSPVDPT
jgi:zinc transport system substrate-binding protein